MKKRTEIQKVAGTLFAVLAGTALAAGGTSDEFKTQPNIDYASLVEGFDQVPQHAKMRTWWFLLEGLATKESITKDLEAMKANGIGGALVIDNGASYAPKGPVFMSDAWQALFAHVIAESTRLGIEISLNIQSGAGDPGNPKIADDNGLKRLVYSETRVSGPGPIELKLPVPKHNAIFYEDVLVHAVRSPAPAGSSSAATQKPIRNWAAKTLNQGGFNPKTDHADHEDTGDEAVIDPSEVVDLTARFKDGTLRWNAPAGEWIIIRYGMTATGKRNDYASAGYGGGLCYDPMNDRGIGAQFKEVAQPLIDIAKKHGDSLKFLHTDSWEMGTCNWTQGFREAFERRRGYSMAPYLPVLAGHVVGKRAVSNRFLEDFRLTVADLIAEENYEVFKRLAHNEGIALHSESAGPHAPSVDGLRTLGNNDIPMGEFWARSSSHRSAESARMQESLAASAAHIYGKRFVAAEGPTSVGPVWERSPSQVKNVIDRAFCSGVNRLNWHTYTSSPDEFGLPGIAYFAGTHLNRNVTWWKESKQFIDYINRTQHMLSQGLHVADVLGYLGSRAPLFAVLPHQERADVPVGYAWDMCNADGFLNRASVRDGRIVMADGKSYALFALPDDSQMFLPVLKKIEQRVRDGMILVGNPPQRPFGLTGYPESDAVFDALVRKLWPEHKATHPGVHAYGKGKVYAGMGVDAVLKQEKIRPDFSWEPKAGVDLRYIHFTSGDVDVYYVVNQWARLGIEDLNYRYFKDLPDRFVQVDASFRVDGERRVERWDPVSGKITPVQVYRREGGTHTLPIALEPEGGAFFVFRKTGQTDQARHFTRLSKDGAGLIDGNTPLEVGASRVFVGSDRLEVLDPGRFELARASGEPFRIDSPPAAPSIRLAGPWEVEFMEKPVLGEPFSEVMNDLKSWTESSNRAVKYFSGTARYSKTFTLDDPSALKGGAYLDLGMVGDIATVRLNGKDVGIYWQAPFIADISRHLVKGENQLEVRVTNLWVNRLIGDEKLPEAERKTSTNVRGHNIFKKLKGPDAEQHLRASGLIGPVEIRFSKIHSLAR